MEESVVVEESAGDIGAAGHLRITKATLTNKYGEGLTGEQTLGERLAATRAAVPPQHSYIADCILHSAHQVSVSAITLGKSPGSDETRPSP